MRMLISTVAPYQWAKLDKAGKPIDKGQFLEAAFLSAIPKQITSVIGVIPADAITFHSVEIPTKKRSNMLAAIPFALEEVLSEEIEKLHFSVMSWTPGGKAQVAVIAKQSLDEWIALFSEAGIKLDNIVSEVSLLPIHPDCDCAIVRRNEDNIFVKTGEYDGFLCDEDTFEYWWSDESNQQKISSVNDQELATKLKANGGENLHHWPIGDDFQSWLAHAPQLANNAPLLLQGEYEPAHLKPNTKWLNLAAGIAASAIILLGASHWFEADKLQARYQQNQQAIHTAFEMAFPDEEYLDLPRQQIASLLSISEGNPGSEMFQYLLDIASKIVPVNQAEFVEINYRNEQLQIGISANSFAALENIATQINTVREVQASLISSGKRADKVVGQIKLARIPNG